MEILGRHQFKAREFRTVPIYFHVWTVVMGWHSPWIPCEDRVMLTMSVIITGSLLNMIMNEVEHGKWIMRVGRDTIDLSWIVVVIQSEAGVFIFEALLIGWLLKTFCSRVQYSIYHSDFPIEGRVRRTLKDRSFGITDCPSSPGKRRRRRP